jgi:Na+-transporting methylmalonyl-CoA/oxaloacetate decarboxylase gamma subunit
MVTIVFMIMVILATIMWVITLMIVTGSAKAVSVRCAEYLGYRAGAKRTVHEPVL